MFNMHLLLYKKETGPKEYLIYRGYITPGYSSVNKGMWGYRTFNPTIGLLESDYDRIGVRQKDGTIYGEPLSQAYVTENTFSGVSSIAWSSNKTVDSTFILIIDDTYTISKYNNLNFFQSAGVIDLNIVTLFKTKYNTGEKIKIDIIQIPN